MRTVVERKDMLRITTTGAQSEQAPQRLRGRGVESGLAHFVLYASREKNSYK